MATTRYDLRVSVSSGNVVKGITQKESEAIFRKPVLETKKDHQIGSVVRAQIPETIAPEEFTLEDLSTGYEELIKRADDLLDTLKSRVGELTLTFEPTARPELAQAVADIFQGELSRVTYPMYLEALRLDKDLAIEIGEQSLAAR